MTELKSQKIFQQTLNTLNEDKPTLLPASQFEQGDEFVAQEQEPLLAEKQLSQIIRPNLKRKWGMAALVTSFTGLLGWQLADSVYSAFLSHDWLSLGWSGFIAALSTFGIARLAKELLILKRLRRHFTVQEQAEKLIQANSVGHAEAFCTDLAKRGTQTIDSQTLSEWKNHLHGAHSDAEVFDLYDSVVMKQQDERALQTISKYSAESAALVAISPLALADMALVAWRSLAMVDELAKIYGVQLGYWARIRLLKSLFKNMALAGASEFAIDASMDMLSTSLASKLSARAGQGIGIGILSARLGIQALTLLRPLPWFPNRQVKLAHVRKQVIHRVKSLISL